MPRNGERTDAADEPSCLAGAGFRNEPFTMAD
jgi:hypothetical protein